MEPNLCAFSIRKYISIFNKIVPNLGAFSIFCPLQSDLEFTNSVAIVSYCATRQLACGA